MMLKKKYRIIESYSSFVDDTSYWIECTTYLFGWKFWIKTIGDYSLDTDEEEQMPFVTYTAAQERVAQLKNKK